MLWHGWASLFGVALTAEDIAVIGAGRVMGLTIKTVDQAGFYAATGRVYGAQNSVDCPSEPELGYLPANLDRDIDFFSAHRDAMALGRIMLHTGWPSGTADRTACFANFNCVDDPDVANGLLEVATGWARARGLSRIAGAVCQMESPGSGPVSAEYDRHLARLLAANGFVPAPIRHSYRIDLRRMHPPAMTTAMQALLDDPSFGFAAQTVATRQRRLADARVILTAALGLDAQLVGPFDLLGQRRAAPAICAVLHHRGQPVAFCLGLPDLRPVLRPGQQRPAQRLRGHLTRLGLIRPKAAILHCQVNPYYQNLGLAQLLLRRVMPALQAGRYQQLTAHSTACLDGLDLGQASIRVHSTQQVFAKAI